MAATRNLGLCPLCIWSGSGRGGDTLETRKRQFDGNDVETRKGHWAPLGTMCMTSVTGTIGDIVAVVGIRAEPSGSVSGNRICDCVSM